MVLLMSTLYSTGGREEKKMELAMAGEGTRDPLLPRFTGKGILLQVADSPEYWHSLYLGP